MVVIQICAGVPRRVYDIGGVAWGVIPAGSRYVISKQTFTQLPACSRQKRSFVVTNLVRLTRGSRAISQVPQRAPLFFNLPEVLESTNSNLHRPPIQYPKQQSTKMSQLFNNNYNSFNTTYINPTIADDRPDIIAWLSPLDPKLRHQDIRDRRVENIGEWVLQTEEFISWYAGSEGDQSDNPVLFCYGGPGVGKTYIW